LAAVLTLVVLRRRSWAFPGLVAIFYLAGYACLRLFTETLRGDHRGPELAGLSLSQLGSLLLLSFAALAFVHLRRRALVAQA
ncbi:MAG: prolipoprotein diacylglyceryl transferase family protein, partial [Spirochaetota bacterium]